MDLNEELRQIPLFLKADEIYILVCELTKLIKVKDGKKGTINNILFNYKNILNNCAFNIPEYIANSFKENIYYHVRMENAACIRNDACAILICLDGLEIYGFKDLDYLELIKKEVEEFRILFAEWVKTFNKNIYVIDTWGLFNPQGVNYDDFDINLLKNEGSYTPYEGYEIENISPNNFEDEDEDDEDDDQSFLDSLFDDKD